MDANVSVATVQASIGHECWVSPRTSASLCEAKPFQKASQPHGGWLETLVLAPEPRARRNGCGISKHRRLRKSQSCCSTGGQLVGSGREGCARPPSPCLSQPKSRISTMKTIIPITNSPSIPARANAKSKSKQAISF